MTHPVPLRLPSSVARSRLSEIITRVQDPRAFVVLTRHDKPVAAVVSMAELHRIWSSQDIEDVVAHGKSPVMFRLGKTGCLTQREAAETDPAGPDGPADGARGADGRRAGASAGRRTGGGGRGGGAPAPLVGGLAAGRVRSRPARCQMPSSFLASPSVSTEAA